MRNASRVAIVTLMMVASSSLVLAQENPGDGKAENSGKPEGTAGHHFHVADPMGRNSITFTSEAPLEDIVGTSNDVTGHVIFDPENPEQAGRGELIVPVVSLNTGIPLCDEHLQGEAWLDAGNYPDIKFVITKIMKIEMVKKSPEFMTYDVVIVGDLTLRGRTRAVEVPGRFTYMKESDKTQQLMPGDLLAARASFEVKLADFGVSGPSGADIIGSKVGEVIAIDVSFRASNAAMDMASESDSK